jgi:hypothetical protein
MLAMARMEHRRLTDSWDAAQAQGSPQAVDQARLLLWRSGRHYRGRNSVARDEERIDAGRAERFRSPGARECVAEPQSVRSDVGACKWVSEGSSGSVIKVW